MKKKKLKLDDLKLQSFIASLPDEAAKNIKGGGYGNTDSPYRTSACVPCPTAYSGGVC
jgi:hypothetical protein